MFKVSVSDLGQSLDVNEIQTIFHFTLQNSSDLEGSDGCDDDSD